MTYHIKIKGHLDAVWSDWFENLTLSQEDDGNTLLICQVADQPALFGLLRKVRDLGITLISVTRVDEPNTSNVNHS